MQAKKTEHRFETFGSCNGHTSGIIKSGRAVLGVIYPSYQGSMMTLKKRSYVWGVKSEKALGKTDKIAPPICSNFYSSHQFLVMKAYECI